MGVFYTIAFILFAVTLAPPPLPSWVIYRTAIFILYAAVHI